VSSEVACRAVALCEGLETSLTLIRFQTEPGKRFLHFGRNDKIERFEVNDTQMDREMDKLPLLFIGLRALQIWVAQAASLQLLAACRQHLCSAGCRAPQASGLRSKKARFNVVTI
jgi:hypothetical protein